MVQTSVSRRRQPCKITSDAAALDAARPRGEHLRRAIVGFYQDDVGDWVAELACRHGQHVRHRPPFDERGWILDAAQRAARIGTDLECPLCDRAELPEGLQLARTAGPFDPDTMPPGLRRTHTVAAGRWGRLRVVRGRASIQLEVDPPISRRLGVGDEQPIPPEVPHLVSVEEDGAVEIDFLVPPGE
jgi:hypothetical protein